MNKNYQNAFSLFALIILLIVGSVFFGNEDASATDEPSLEYYSTLGIKMPLVNGTIEISKLEDSTKVFMDYDNGVQLKVESLGSVIAGTELKNFIKSIKSDAEIDYSKTIISTIEKDNSIKYFYHKNDELYLFEVEYEEYSKELDDLYKEIITNSEII